MVGTDHVFNETIMVLRSYQWLEQTDYHISSESHLAHSETPIIL